MRWISVNKNKLNIFLGCIGFYAYFKFFFQVYDIIVFDLLSLPFEFVCILDIVIMFLYFMTCIPCTMALKHLIIKFLSK